MLAGKVIAVTAAATDDGAGCVRGFCSDGADVLALDADKAALERLAAGCSDGPGQVGVLAIDLSKPDALDGLSDRIARDFPIVDGLVTCPKDWEIASIEDSSVESWRRVLTANVVAPVVAVKAFLPSLKRSSGGAIVHIGSVDGILGNSAVPSYSASKGAMVSLTHVMADEFGAHGIRVNCIARAMATERGAPVPDVFAPLLRHTPLGRPGYHDEVAAAARFLLSDDASYITGAVLPVDGGRSAVTQGTRIRG